MARVPARRRHPVLRHPDPHHGCGGSHPRHAGAAASACCGQCSRGVGLALQLACPTHLPHAPTPRAGMNIPFDITAGKGPVIPDPIRTMEVGGPCRLHT